LQSRVPRALIIAVLAVAAALLSACSALRLGYGQAPELAYWWLDGYADFDDPQTVRVRADLAAWFAWHRRSQLPDYADLLSRAQAELPADTTPQRICLWWDQLRSRIDVGLEQGVPAAADLMLTLKPAQWQHMERRYAKGNAEFRDEYLDADPAQRLKDSVQRAIARAETVYGRLDEGQRQLVAATVAQSPFDAELWLAERQRRQQDALALMRQPPATRDAAQAALRAYVEHVKRSPRDDYRRYAQRLTTFNCGFAATLHNATTAAQRQAAVQKFKGWEDDLRALAADLPK